LFPTHDFQPQHEWPVAVTLNISAASIVEQRRDSCRVVAFFSATIMMQQKLSASIKMYS